MDTLARSEVRASRHVNAAEQVAAGLRRAILGGELMPGDHVRQEVWAERLKVSRLPVREALKVLASEGLCSHDRHRGYFVATLDVGEISQIYWMRRQLEPALATTMRWPGAAELRAITVRARQMEDALRSGDLLRAMEEERTFDYGIFDLSTKTIVAREVKRLWSLLDPYRLLAFSGPDAYPRIVDRHRGFLDALRAQDAAALTGAMLRTHERMLDNFVRPRFTARAGADADG